MQVPYYRMNIGMTFFLKRSIHLFETQSYTEKGESGREGQILHPLVHFSALGQVKTRNQEPLPDLPYRFRDPGTWTSNYCFLQDISREQNHWGMKTSGMLALQLAILPVKP